MGMLFKRGELAVFDYRNEMTFNQTNNGDVTLKEVRGDEEGKKISAQKDYTPTLTQRDANTLFQ